MSVSITRSEATQLLKKLDSTRTALKRTKERAAESIGRVVQTTEVGGAAFACGVINGRYGGVDVAGVPFELLTAGGLQVLGFAGIAPEHTHNFADGCLAAYLTVLGSGVGRDMLDGGAAAGRMRDLAYR